MKLKHVFLAALVGTGSVPAMANPVIVTFGGTYDASSKLAGQSYTGSFAYDTNTTPFQEVFNQDGTVNKRVYKSVVTSPFTIIDASGVHSSSKANTVISIFYNQNYTQFDASGYEGPPGTGMSLDFITTDTTFAKNGLPTAYPAVSTFTYSQGYTQTAGQGPLTSLTASAGPVAAVPEPATWGMMIGGFAAAGIALRRRRERVAVRYA